MTARKSEQKTADVWSLSLFVAGREHPKSVAAYANLKRICEEHLPGAYQLQVIDITKAPEAAIKEEVLAIPTLVRRSPPPKRRIIGDLSDTDRVLVSLGLQTPGAESLPF